ncbi:TetR family transcriptional regulator C-terminal domain-containing protein [Streptomyces sp. AV19]|uniref:TetR/AcrR family transcriptional regulator n=1 Tax=Streptomyces sp. AV19 TaxID=2793068 RepID=UPI0018FE1213|nr:TetR family transcriptional regulator C-terminal domain-containing protein [Streptomyces sp. AV19]MBH1936397.1 TetR family transcriptional regulator C-terminal domain-containing protein [Streptomyces sp. AV19]MDG4532436.1 TetR family transcriptional regulator C-terminal domain-containing protein [Streptomyces sp. AV19]
MPRRHDPGRRDRIVDAAIRVVAGRGIGALSHRSAAAEADVPLGSTTYHFKTLDDLLVEALRRTARGWLDVMSEWERGLPDDLPLAGFLTRMAEESLTGDRARLELEYELYAAGLRRPALRPVVAECVEEMVAITRRRTPDEATARAAVALIDGLLLQYLLSDRPFDRDAVRAAVSRITAGP